MENFSSDNFVEEKSKRKTFQSLSKDINKCFEA
jgi:hypothetical protein